MTRVVVQRGVSNAPQSRLNANPSSSSPPVPPPLPPPYVPPASSVSGPLPTSQSCPGTSHFGEDGSDEDRKVSDNVSQVNPYLIIHPEQKARGTVIENDLSETATEQISSSLKHTQISKSAETSRQGLENADGGILSHGDYGSKTSENLDGRNETRSQSMVENMSMPSGDRLPYDNLDVPRSSSGHGNSDMPRASHGHPSPLPSSSRRSGWIGSSGSSICRPVHYRGLQRNSPHGSRSTSPRARAEDGYNSADELNSWTSGSSCYEDNEERESKFEIALRRLKGLELRRMAEDGNCLFRSVADQVYGDAEMYEETRQLCIDYMEKERDHFSQFVTESFTAYCKRKRRDKVYGNNLEIQAMAEMYNRPIHIYSYSTEPINIFHGQYDSDLAPIRLSYYKGNHYNSIHDPRRPSIGAGLGFGSLHGGSANTDQVKTAIKEQQEQQIDRALLAEGRYYSDLEFTEHEIERMVMEASRIEFLAEEKNRQQHLQGGEETSTSTAAEPSSSGTTSANSQNDGENEARYILSSHNSYMGGVDGDAGLTSNVRMLLSMGFNYLRVMEAFNIFGDDVNNMLCYLLEVETNNLVENMYRKKGKAAET